MMRFLPATLVACLFMVLPLATPIAAHDDDNAALEIIDPWARETMGRTSATAVYLTLQNQSGHKDKLVAVSTASAAMAHVHQSSVSTDGIASMDRVEALDIPAHETVAFAPGGLHIMLMQLTRPLKKGDIFWLTLTFEQAGTVKIPVTVQSLRHE